MNEINHPPRASAMINSLRAIGYSFDSAIADLIDNSISADATRVDILFNTSPAYVSVIDDGLGMSEDQLIVAMRHGGVGPHVKRGPKDLGRYGLGLKTASLSQCRKMTVVTMKDGTMAAASWDLDEIERRDEWMLQLPAPADLNNIPGIDVLKKNAHGTIVLWEVFDRALAGEADPAVALQKLVLGSGDHLALVFHRFIKPDFGKALSIAINNRAVEPLDPFLRNHRFTELVGSETRRVDGHNVELKAYILPHISKLSAHDLELAGGKEHLRDMQGFYIYRNRRLIIWGTWFRLIGRDELSRLARVQVDIPNALDHLWNLDIKKSAAFPPEPVRSIFRQIVYTVAAKSSHVFQDKRRRTDSSRVTYLWERTKSRDGVHYELNNEHPLVMSLAQALDLDLGRLLDRLLEAIELSLPVRSIYVDQASNETVAPLATTVTDELSSILQAMLETPSSAQNKHDLLKGLPFMEPFRNYPDVTKALVEKFADDRTG